jgi:hypothetical protein
MDDEKTVAVRSTGIITTTKKHKEKRKRLKRKVLPEEEYLDRLSAILRRDFFPQLAKLEAQYEYLTALERSDLDALKKATDRLNATPTDDAPKLTLDEFQARYVTEDTDEFEELIERINSVKSGSLAKVLKRTVPLLTASTVDPTKAGPSRGRILRDNTRLEKRVELGVLERDVNDIRHHYWRMLKEFGNEESEASVRSTSTRASKEYAFVETPDTGIVAGTPARFVQPTPQRQRNDLLKSPAVRRLLRNQTPRESVFAIPSTPKRKK